KTIKSKISNVSSSLPTNVISISYEDGKVLFVVKYTAADASTTTPASGATLGDIFGAMKTIIGFTDAAADNAIRYGYNVSEWKEGKNSYSLESADTTLVSDNLNF